MVETRYHASVKDLQGLDLTGTGPFGRIEWFALLEDAGLRPVVAVATHGDGSACMVLERAGRGLCSAQNWYAFTWQPLTRGDAPPLDALLGGLADKANRLDLAKLAEKDARALAAILRKQGWIVRQQPCDTNRILRVKGRSYADYHTSLPGRLRTTLKRKAKKVDVRIVSYFDDAIWRSYEEIYAESWKPEEGDPALLRRFAKAQGDRIRLACAYADGQAVAAQFWSVEDGVAYIHKLAHRESAKPLSPGSTLTAALMEKVIDEDGVEIVDFGTGDDPYKQDWMNDARIRHSLTAWRMGDARNWPAIARHAFSRLVRYKPSR